MIYVITHKSFDDTIIDIDHYRILHVGNNLDSKSSYLRDDCGDNISFKNENYCELTGLYWIWKNGKEEKNDITGLVHYRRFFTTVIQDLEYTYFNKKMPAMLDYSAIEKYCREDTIILPKRYKIYRTVREFYGDMHYGEDLDLVGEVIQECFPEYLSSFQKVMNSHYYYYGNMILCKKGVLDSYSEWLFAILNKLEEKIDINKYSDTYQKRVYGFLAERLLQVWVYHGGYKIKEFPVFNTEEKRMNFFEINGNRVRKLLTGKRK